MKHVVVTDFSQRFKRRRACRVTLSAASVYFFNPSRVRTIMADVPVAATAAKKSQLFHAAPPLECLRECLGDICFHCDERQRDNGDVVRECLITSASFQRGMYITQSIPRLLLALEPYYYPSKRHYVTRTDMCLKHFYTVVRQICRCWDVSIEKSVAYTRSECETQYMVLLPSA